MCKHGGTPSPRDKHVYPTAISPPGVARGRSVGGQQSGLAGCKPPPLFTRGASSCSSQGGRQGEPRGASPRPSAPTYLLEAETQWDTSIRQKFMHFIYSFDKSGNNLHEIRMELQRWLNLNHIQKSLNQCSCTNMNPTLESLLTYTSHVWAL